jgi:hypothetical protein
MKSLKFFSEQVHFSGVDRLIMTHLIEYYQTCLPPAAAALLTAGLDFEQYCAAWPAQFKSLEGFGAPLVEALTAIEKLSLPENAALLEQARGALPAGYDLKVHRSSLHQCTHLWMICQRTPGVVWPMERGAVESGAETPSPGPLAPTVSAEAVDGDQEGNKAPAAPVEPSTAPSAQPDFVRFARLSPAEYDRVRRAEAKRLGLRVRTFDEAVEEARSGLDDAEANKMTLSQVEPWPEPIVDGPGLFDKVHDRALMYLYLPPGAAVVLTLWPTHAHAINAFTHTPRLNLTSAQPGCGKSTVLDFLATLCPRVLHTNNLKPAVLYRVMHRGQLTVLLDELDVYLELYPALRGLLNASNKPTSCVHRCEGNAVREFKIFAATALAGLGHLTPTLRHRSIVITLEEAPPGVLRERFDPRHIEIESALGRQMARWAKDNFAALAGCDPVMPATAHNRLADNWRPLFAIGQVIGGHWPQRILEAFEQLTAKAAPGPDMGLELLVDIGRVFKESGAERLFSSALVDSLCALEGRPWASMGNGSVGPISELWLSRQLRRFGVRSRTLRIDGEKAKGYDLADFREAFRKGKIDF